MKKTTKILLVGVCLTSTITAGITSSNSIESKKRNIELSQKLKESFANYDKLHTENKKLSKRVINEINRIITLSDSVKQLDKFLKKSKSDMSSFITLSNKTKSKKTTSRNNKLSIKGIEKNTLLYKYNNLNNKITESKLDVLEIKKSITESVFISNIETTPMKKKTRGGFTATGNYKKIDGFKTTFEILNNDISNSEKKKVSLKLLDSDNNVLNHAHDLQLDFDKRFMNVVTFIEVERKQITSGNYKLIVLVDDKEIKSSNIKILIE